MLTLTYLIDGRGRLLIFRNFSDPPELSRTPHLLIFKKKVSDQDAFLPICYISIPSMFFFKIFKNSDNLWQKSLPAAFNKAFLYHFPLLPPCPPINVVASLDFVIWVLYFTFANLDCGRRGLAKIFCQRLSEFLKILKRTLIAQNWIFLLKNAPLHLFENAM